MNIILFLTMAAVLEYLWWIVSGKKAGKWAVSYWLAMAFLLSYLRVI